MCDRELGLAGSSLRLQRGALLLRSLLFFNAWILIANPAGLQNLISFRQHFLRTLNGKSKLVKDTGNMGRMVGDRKFLLNDSGDHGARPHARSESVCHRTAVQDVGQFLSLIIGHAWWTSRSMPLKNSIHSALLPVPQPHRDFGTVNLEDVSNFRSCPAFHIESNCVKTSSNTICPIVEGLLANLNQLMYLFDRSMNLNRSHGTSYLGDDAIISYVALFMQGYIEAYKIEKMRLKGNYNNWHDDFRSSLKKQESLKQINTEKVVKNDKIKLLSELIAEYTKEKIEGKAWNAKNAEETLAFYKQFVEIIGDKNIKEYDRTELLDYRGLLIKFPANVNKHKDLRDLPLEEVINLIKNDDLPPCRILSTKTVNKNLVRINAIFEYAQKRGDITVNPAYKLKIVTKKKKASEEKDPYSKDDIEKLITSPAFAKVDKERPERFWIPLIALYSGCRLGEICQLYKSDIKEDYGIPHFDINDEEDKVLKTASSKRVVPISPELLKLGFTDYVKSVKHIRLWSNLKRRRDGYGQ